MQKPYKKNAIIFYICRENSGDQYAKGKKYFQVREHCHYTGKHRGAAHDMHNFKNSVSKEIPKE